MTNPITVRQNPSRLRSLLTSQKFILLMLAFAAMLPTLMIWNRASYATGDSYMFMRAGLNVVRGRGFTGMDGGFMYVQDRPLYPIAIGLASFVTSHIETAARLISLFGATLAVLAFYWLVRRRHSQTMAIFAAIVFAFLPLRVWSGQWILTDGLALGLAMSGLAVLFAYENPSRANAIVAGCLLGLAYLTRSEALIFVAGGFVYLLVFSASRGLKNRLLVSSLLVIGFALVALPHHLWLYKQLGTFSPHRFVDNLKAAEALYQGWSMPFDVHFDESSGKFAKAVPNLTLVAILRRYVFFAKQEIARLVYLPGPLILILIPCVIGGVRFLLGLARRRIDAFWQALLLLPLLVLPLLRIEDRYLLSALPVLCLWMVDGAVTIGKFLNKQLQRLPRLTFVTPTGVAAIFLVLLLGGYAHRLTTLLPTRDYTLLPKQAASWMQATHLPEGRIIAQEPALAFYNASIQVWLPYGPLDRVLSYARQQHARYVFVSPNDASNPLKDRLLADTELPRGLLLLQSFQTEDGSAKLLELVP